MKTQLWHVLVFAWYLGLFVCYILFVVGVYAAYDEGRPLTGLETFVTITGLVLIFLQELGKRLDELNIWLKSRRRTS